MRVWFVTHLAPTSFLELKEIDFVKSEQFGSPLCFLDLRFGYFNFSFNVAGDRQPCDGVLG